MTQVITGLSSMATKHLVAELVVPIGDALGVAMHFASAGGVEVARRVREGSTRTDLVILADAAMRSLSDEGLVSADSLRALFVSQVVAAVPDGTTLPAFMVEDDLRQVLLDAGRIGYSTGPSGTALLELIAAWELADALEGRLVQAAPGVPVGTMIARGDADLGFQQHSELKNVDGITVLGPLPGQAAINSIFTGGVLVDSAEPELAGHVIDLLTSRDAAATIRRRGMQVARLIRNPGH